MKTGRIYLTLENRSKRKLWQQLCGAMSENTISIRNNQVMEQTKVRVAQPKNKTHNQCEKTKLKRLREKEPQLSMVLSWK